MAGGEMADCDERFHRINKNAAVIFSSITEECQKTLDWLESYREEILAKMKEATNEKYEVPILPKQPLRNKRIKRRAMSTSSEDEGRSNSKEEVQSSNVTDSSLSLSGKPKRNASKLAEQKINIQSQVSLKSKMRRPGKDDTVLNDISNNTIHLKIKSEKKSASPPKDAVPQIQLQSIEVKKENMPPPATKPKRGRKKIKKEVESSDTENEGSVRITRSKRTVNSTASTKSTKTTSRSRKDSDVILQEVPVPVVEINDSDTDVTIASQANSEVEDPKQVEDTPAESDDDQPLKPRKPKKKPAAKSKKTQKKVAETKDDSVYEDALPIVNKDDEKILNKQTEKQINCTVVLERDPKISALNSTHIIERPAPTLNETRVIQKAKTPELKAQNGITDCAVVLQKMNETVTLSNKTVVLSPKENGHQWKKADIPPPVDNLITDDDDSIVKATPEKKPEPPRKGIKTKQMFSPYANSPVRKRVAAFEKLVANDPADAPARVTRTKTRNMDKDKENKTSSESSRIPAKTKYFTPTANNKLPSLIPQSESKAYKLGRTTNKTSSVLPIKSASALKPSRAELQVRREEEQKKRLEKEEEARRKREAIMQAKADEQRKKREEKQLRAQKAREEMEREKEERLRLAIQEKEEEQQKKREWQMKQQAEMEERKKAEERIKLQKQRLMEEKRKQMLASKPPPLPTDDCEDSDSSTDTVTTKYIKPEWAQSHSLIRSMIIQRYISKARLVTLFQMAATTPDLQEIFETVDERLLRRNSSAVWRTPPRYSTLPKF